jgi:hypothetical protein
MLRERMYYHAPTLGIVRRALAYKLQSAATFPALLPGVVVCLAVGLRVIRRPLRRG